MWPFDTVTADEASKLRKTSGCCRAANAPRPWPRLLYTRKVRRWINLSGTIAPNGLQQPLGADGFIDT